jgi:predicted Zn-dependent protease
VLLIALLAGLAAAPLTRAETSPLLDILGAELDRNYKVMKEKADPAPYFMAYSVTDTESWAVSATSGALQSSTRGRSRILDVTVRVGSPQFDNYHVIRGERYRFTTGALVPVEDSAPAIRRRLWLETDRTYRAAAQRFVNLKTRRDLTVAPEDASHDFSVEKPETSLGQLPKLSGVPEDWEDKARRWSRQLGEVSGVLAASVVVMSQAEAKHLVSTEGSRIRHGRGFVRIVITARGKSEDGMDLATTDSFEATTAKGLPDDEAVEQAVRRVGEDLKALLNAPVVDPFVGPAILSGKAAGVFFHEIFGHRIEGHRQKDDEEGQTFTKSIGQPVLPSFLTVLSDPTRSKAAGIDLNGTYVFDDEGVRARPVTLVDSGILKTFLMSRTPVKGFAASNGHGRRQSGAEVVSRQSNLIVESAKPVPDKELRELLITEIKRQNKPYGLMFRDITGGFTTTQRRGVQAFKVIPLVVFRVYADGRPDELVRGVDIVGTPLASFSRIVATSDKPEVFNGYCGAESGSVPVSAVAPALLVSEIEISKKERGRDGPPILPPPVTGQDASALKSAGGNL